MAFATNAGVAGTPPTSSAGWETSARPQTLPNGWRRHRWMGTGAGMQRPWSWRGSTQSDLSGVTSQSLRSISRVTWQEIATTIQVSPQVDQSRHPRKPGQLTVSVPSLHVLLRSWAISEGRELTSVVLQCVELSVRQLKSNGAIPSAAIRQYESACEERLAVGGL